MYAQSRADQTINNKSEDISSIVERFRADPALQSWVLMAPTRTLVNRPEFCGGLAAWNYAASAAARW